MLNQYSRTELVMGQEALDKLRSCRVAVFGIGGVGGSVVETLARSGVGTIDVIDDDKICLTNLNRQILATRATVGMYKADAAEERIHQIDPDIVVNKHKVFYLPGESADSIDFSAFDYVVDSLDTMSAKIDIVMKAKEAGVPVISCMGCGNRVDPSKLQITDIYKTSMDPLSKIMRKEMKKRRVRRLKVVFTTEPPIRPLKDNDNSCRFHCICPPGTKRKCTERRDIPGSTAFVPPAAGIMAASEVVRDLTQFDPSGRIKGGRQD
ncbi:tRNA threonylcarbamoyladenosine dehydratase [Eubacterium sp. F2]|uniref:tRNA threonylcarbamoyladenosine dehydratase n=1 Tax=Eubacterium sp. F2 TaxID=3381348 RepID=UPI0039081063